MKYAEKNSSRNFTQLLVKLEHMDHSSVHFENVE